MKLKQEVERELIGLAVASYATAGASPTRLADAQALVKAHHIHTDSLAPATVEEGWAYLCTATEEDHIAEFRNFERGLERMTEKGCTCADFAAHSQQSPPWDCQHRLAAFLYRRVVRGLDELVASGIPHRHRYTCSHAEGWVECWQEACDDGETIQCASCEAVEQTRAIASVRPAHRGIDPEQPSPHIVEYQGHRYALNEEEYDALCSHGDAVAEGRCTSDEAVAAVLRGAGLLPDDTPPLECPDCGYTTDHAKCISHGCPMQRPVLDYTREQYEPNPTPTGWEPCEHGNVRPGLPCPNDCGFVQHRDVTPLPEAAASLTLKVPLRGGGDMLYAVRGHTDAEVQTRADAVLAWLLTKAPQRCQDHYDKERQG